MHLLRLVGSAATLVVACNSSGNPTSTTCSQSLSSYCGGASCDLDWAAAQARWAASLCSPGMNEIGTGCAGFDVLIVENLDAPVSEYFDSTTGALIAVTQNSKDFHTCAGPSSFAAPSCPSAMWQHDCGDARDGAADSAAGDGASE